MNLYVIETGLFKLDGGAMFGVVPKVLWNKLNPADEKNLCTWSMRCLLVEEGDKLILIDTGIGDKQDEKFFSHYYLNLENTLKSSLKKVGFSPDDVTDVLLTHLHFDHVGGATEYNASRTAIVPVFKNARYWIDEDHWNWAIDPNPREKASFLKENLLPLQESGQLYFVKDYSGTFPGITLLPVDGHTEKQLIPFISYKTQTLVYCADLIPSLWHISLPYVMSYDVRPLLTMKEKAEVLKEAADKDFILFFEHDPVHQCCRVTQTERGVRHDATFDLKEIV